MLFLFFMSWGVAASRLLHRVGSGHPGPVPVPFTRHGAGLRGAATLRPQGPYPGHHRPHPSLFFTWEEDAVQTSPSHRFPVSVGESRERKDGKKGGISPFHRNLADKKPRPLDWPLQKQLASTGRAGTPRSSRDCVLPTGPPQGRLLRASGLSRRGRSRAWGHLCPPRPLALCGGVTGVSSSTGELPVSTAPAQAFLQPRWALLGR